MDVLGDVGHTKSCFCPFGDIVSVGPNRYMIFAKCTIGSKIDLDAPNGTPR
jgi:hypothetical protein